MYRPRALSCLVCSYMNAFQSSVQAEGGNEAAPSAPPKKSVDFDAASHHRCALGDVDSRRDWSLEVPEPRSSAPSKATRKGMGSLHLV